MQHLRKFLEYKYDIDSINENKINYLQKRHLDKKKDKNNQETDLQDKTWFAITFLITYDNI